MENEGATIRTASDPASKLEVFAPTPSTLSRSNRNFNEIAEKINPPRPAKRSSKKRPAVPGKTDQVLDFSISTDDAPINPDSIETATVSRTALGRLFNKTPSWLVSFVFHLGLILLLAILTFSVSQNETIYLEASEVAQLSPQTMSFELELDDAELEDMSESLDSDEMEMDIPEVDLFDAPVEEAYEVNDPFEVPDLAEFGGPKPNENANETGDSSESQGQSQGTGEQSELDGSVEFFGTKAYGSDFVFVIDCSSSMSQNTRWYRALNELLSALGELDSEQNFLVILYNDRTFMMWGAPMNKSLVPGTDENKAKTETWLRQAYPNSGTRPASSVQLALKKQPDAIYFLSDGELRDNTMSGLRKWNRVKRGVDGKKRKTPIHTILLESPFGQRTMRTIAEENNGIFTFVR